MQIFATDLDQDAIDKARKGLYSLNIVNDVSAERLGRFFILEPEGYRVAASIREMVVFAGKATYNIYVMAREGLRDELPGAIRKAVQNFDEIILRNLKVGTNGGTLIVDVTLQCLDT